jgi:hypothetical protein
MFDLDNRALPDADSSAEPYQEAGYLYALHRRHRYDTIEPQPVNNFWARGRGSSES